MKESWVDQPMGQARGFCPKIRKESGNGFEEDDCRAGGYYTGSVNDNLWIEE
jgi:hypothetical protein